MSLFDHIRTLARRRCTRLVAAFVLLMCTVTWVGQSVSAVQDGDLAVALAAADAVAVPAADAVADGEIGRAHV